MILRFLCSYLDPIPKFEMAASRIVPELLMRPVPPVRQRERFSTLKLEEASLWPGNLLQGKLISVGESTVCWRSTGIL